MPDANVAIELASLYGSRRQEAQRLGRILRSKSTVSEGSYDSYFYSLISMGTEEVGYALKRQKFLIKQGYCFQIKGFEEYQKEMERLNTNWKLATDVEQLDFLRKMTIEATKADTETTRTQATNAEENRFLLKRREENQKRLYIENK